MLRISVVAIALSFSALQADHVIAGGLLLYEVGTEDVGLAAAGYAVRAQDATTVFTNPAGMTRLDGNQLQLGTQVLYSDIKFSASGGTSAALRANSSGNVIGKQPC